MTTTKTESNPSKLIGEEDCLLACHESTITFTVDYGSLPVTDISWTSEGGYVVSLSNGDAVAEISWPTVQSGGGVFVEVSLADGQVISGGICVTTKAKPEGGFEILGQVSQYFCSETELVFQNQFEVPDGTQIVASVWDFGDGNTSNETNPTHTYYAEGTYQISLTVYDECGCSSMWRESVTITKPGIIIECATAVCQGAIETYTLEGPAYANGNVNCQNYQWTAVGGQVMNQGQDWVQIHWKYGTPDGFGYLYFDQASCDVMCDNQMVIKVPIIATEGTIRGGATELCKGEQSRYALPQWPTTEVSWTVFPTSNPGNPVPSAVILTDQRNEVAVDAGQLQSGEYILRAEYANTLLKCGGEAEFTFTVTENLEIDQQQFQSEICEGHTADFYLTETISGVTWTVSQDGQPVAVLNGSGANSHASHSFTSPGYYTVSATADDYCTDFANVVVVDIPSVNAGMIEGADRICPARAEAYTFVSETNGFDIVWSVDHGSFLGPNVGEEVTVEFQDGNSEYELTVQLVHPQLHACSSDPAVFDVELDMPDAEIVQTTGSQDAICSSSEESFELQGYPDMDIYQWSILPVELANVSQGDGTENVTILFNEPYLGQTQGTIAVSAKVCGVMTELDQIGFELNENPVLSIADAPSAVCADETFDIVVSVSPPINASYLSISFTAPLSGPNPGAVQTSPGVYEFQNMELANINPGESVNVGYVISANGPDLCSEVQVSGSVERHPAPIVEVSHIGGTVFCTVGEITTVLQANLQGTGVGVNDISWMYGGNSIGSGPVLNLGTTSGVGFGTYTAVATNAAGCQTVSNAVSIIQDCTPPEPACQNESVSVSGQWTDCNLIDISATYSGTPITKTFLLGEGFTNEHATPLQPSTTGNTLSQSFEVDASGIYVFGFVAEYANCMLVSEPIIVNVEYQAKMLGGIVCDQNGYSVTIFNQSTYLPGANPQVDYTFATDPGGQTTSPDSQDDNEATAILGNGDYLLTLTLSGTGKPTCKASGPISLQKPNANFTLVETEVCSDVEVHLTPDEPTPGASYLWEFQDATNTLESIHPTLAGSAPIGSEITLTVSDPYGCSDSYSDSIMVYGPVYQGELDPDNADICPSQQIEIIYNDGFTSPTSYQWLKNTVEISGATNDNLSGITTPGEYSIYLYDDLGCVDKTISSAFVNLIQPPHLSALISGSVCAGDDVSISGTLNPEDTEYRISRSTNGGPYAVVHSWTDGPDIDFTDTAPSAGEYTYRVEYKDNNTECVSERFFDAVVHPTPNVFVVKDGHTCSPYTVQLTATGNQPGTYLWSNGMSGATITVDHGGPFMVNFYPEGGGCAATTTYVVPKSPDVFSWIFPTGCFSYCHDIKNYPYIIGPIPQFEGYRYDLDNNTIDGGMGVVPDLPIIHGMNGSLDLMLNNGYCSITTDILDITVLECDDCNDPIHVTEVVELTDPTGFVYYDIVDGSITNPTNQPVTISLTSIHGTFVPAVLMLPPGGAYSFSMNPVLFIPFAPLQAPVFVEFTIHLNNDGENKIICSGSIYLDMEALQSFAGGGGPPVEMRVVPNPAEHIAQVGYTVHDLPDYSGGTVKLFGLDGRLLAERQTIDPEGVVFFDLSGLASGTYVVVFLNEGRRVGQQLIVKY